MTFNMIGHTLMVFLCSGLVLVFANNITSGAAKDESTVPAWCYKPPGTDCTWYKQCLVRSHSCESDNSSYAMAFGDAMCTAFSDWWDDFSEPGKEWIDNTRACLQTQLVPVLKLDATMTCSDIKSFAFRTHSKCYLNPAVGSSSFCDLPFADWFRIAWIVKQAFVSETGETVHQVAQILGGCASHGISGLFG